MNSLRKWISLVLVVFYSFIANTLIGQNVGINATGASPDASAILDLSSTSKGLLVPRMTSAQRTAISSPATGLLVYDNTTGSFWYYSGSSWINLSAAGASLTDNDNDTKIQVEESPDEDIVRIDIAGSEKWVFTNNGIDVMNTGNSVFIGENAGLNDDLSSNYNVGIGHETMKSNTTGERNCAMGYLAFFSNTTGSNNIAIGNIALYYNTTGDYNTATGSRSLHKNTTGYNNTAYGGLALFNNTSGYENAADGYQSLYSNTTGFKNSAFGVQTLYSNTSGRQNTASGHSALNSNTTGNYNSALGSLALTNNSSGSYNSALGSGALSSNTT